MLNLKGVKERFKSNAPIKRALPQRDVFMFNIKLGEELVSKKNRHNFAEILDVTSADNQWACSSARQSTWLLQWMEYQHSFEDTRWSGVQIPPSPLFTP
jgi:hypothetical protein